MEKVKKLYITKENNMINDASIEEDPKALGDIIYMQNLLSQEQYYWPNTVIISSENEKVTIKRI